MRDSYGMLSVRAEDTVTVVTLDRPEKLNAMTNAFWTDLTALLADAEQSPDTKVVVFHGSGRAFSAGGDIEEFGDLDDIPSRRRYQQRAFSAFRALEVFPKPTIAAVHGYALGGGCELTMVCDIVVADPTARFGTPEASIGLMPGLAVARGLANTNLHWMKYMVFTGANLDAEEARLAGLVNLVSERGAHLDVALGLARTIAAKPAVAIEVAKRILNRGGGEGYDYALEATALLHSTADQHEGVSAFKEGRSPSFRDQ